MVTEKVEVNKNTVSKDKIKVSSQRCGKSNAPLLWQFIEFSDSYPIYYQGRVFIDYSDGSDIVMVNWSTVRNE